MATKKESRNGGPVISIERFRHVTRKPNEPSQPVVSQTDLENIVTLRTQIERLRRNLGDIQHKVIESMVGGGEVEDGRRTVELVSKFEGGQQIHWIEVD